MAKRISMTPTLATSNARPFTEDELSRVPDFIRAQIIGTCKARFPANWRLTANAMAAGFNLALELAKYPGK